MTSAYRLLNFKLDFFSDTHVKALAQCVADAKRRHSELAAKSNGLVKSSFKIFSIC